MLTVISKAIELSNDSKHTLFSLFFQREIEKITCNAKTPFLWSREFRLAARDTEKSDEFISKVVDALSKVKNKKGILVSPKSIVILKSCLIMEIRHLNRLSNSFDKQIKNLV